MSRFALRVVVLLLCAAYAVPSVYLVAAVMDNHSQRELDLTWRETFGKIERGPSGHRLGTERDCYCTELK